MANIEMNVFYRVLTRSSEIAAEPGMDAGVVHVYHSLLAQPAQAYMEAHDATKSAETRRNKARKAFDGTISSIDRHYKVARSVLLAFSPNTTVPETLKAQRTDTDKVKAAADLMKAVKAFAGQPWADGTLAGTLGKMYATLLEQHTETVSAESAWDNARRARQEMLGPAYEQFMAYKRVVREALGSKSKQYRRIHVRNMAKVIEGENPTPEENPPASKK